MPRQLSLVFREDKPAEHPPQRKEAEESPSGGSVQAVAEALRSRLLKYLGQPDREIELRELRNALGHPGEYMDGDPQSNPVNRLVKEMRDAGELVVQEFDRGSPLVSLPSSEESSVAVAPPPLVRPDRQWTFEGVPHYEWPKPEEDRDSITVDRLYDDIDGQSHRFRICRGDRVEAFFRRDKVECGEVVGISHARGEVSVRFGDTGEGIWFSVGQIYPAPELQQTASGKVSLSSVVEAASVEPEGGFTEADRVPTEGDGESAGSAVTARDPEPAGLESLAEQRPYSLHEFREYRDRFDAGRRL